MNHTSQAILKLQERVSKLEAILTALGIDIETEMGKKSGSDAIIGSLTNNLVASRRGGEEWLTAREVGKHMGQSSSWVRQHAQFLPDSAKRQMDGGRRTWHYLWNENTREIFINIKTN